MTSAEPLSLPTRFGAFVAPYHDPAGNPTLQLRRDLDLAVLLDDLGYDEVWFGEHHSGAYEMSASPEVMIAAAGERTRRIMLGTGVNSLTYHHPFILADRIVQLDHLTAGRVMLGMGPGQLPSDAFMMGIDPRRQRDMMVEAAEVIVRAAAGRSRHGEDRLVHPGRRALAASSLCPRRHRARRGIDVLTVRCDARRPARAGDAFPFRH